MIKLFYVYYIYKVREGDFALLKHLRTHMRWIMIAIALAFLLSTFLMYDSGTNRGREPSDGRFQDYAVAAVNGREMMRSELEMIVRNYIQQSNIREISSADIPYLYQAAFDNAVFQIELDKEVDSRNLDVSEDEITFQINNMADQFPTREAFFQSIERSGVKMEDLRRDLRRQIEMEKTIENHLAGQEVVSEDAVSSFYDMMKGLFYSRPKGFLFDVIRLSDDKTAGDLRAKIAENSENWREIVSEDVYSSDILGVSPEPSFFSERALSEDESLSFMIHLEIGEVGGVAEMSSNDYMIAIKRENREETFTPFDEVSLDIRMMLEQRQQRAALDAFRRDLTARAVVEIYDNSIFPVPEPVTPETTDEPVEPETTDTPVEPETTDIPVEPETTDTPVEPEITDTPVEPEITDIPVGPETTDTPVEPEITDTPVEPEIADTLVEPEITDIPVEPETMDIPVEPEITGTPVEPEITDTPVEPETADIPVEPETNDR